MTYFYRSTNLKENINVKESYSISAIKQIQTTKMIICTRLSDDLTKHQKEKKSERPIQNMY